MSTAQRFTALVIPAALIFTLGGCSLLTTGGDQAPLTGIAACALGHTWSLDTAALAEQVKTSLTKDGVAVQDVTVDGTQTMDWTVEGHVTLTSDYTMTITSVPAADQLLTVKTVHSGTTTGAAYINGEVAIPRKWNDGKFSIDVTADNTGTEVPRGEIPYAVPATDFDDSVGLELTCNGNELTTHPRGTTITQTWAKADKG